MYDNKVWIFPKSVSIEEVSEYVERLKNIKASEVVTFDLSKTVNIHSSFIGFLIHAKHHINKNGGRLVLLLSLTVEKILIMLDIIEYFSPEIDTSFNKKTA
jgi:predicted DNA-binding ArsR family transcriptional regulator